MLKNEKRTAEMLQIIDTQINQLQAYEKEAAELLRFVAEGEQDKAEVLL